MNLEWEKIQDKPHIYSDRLRVPGGWIVRTVVAFDRMEGSAASAVQTFVEDPNHYWEDLLEVECTCGSTDDLHSKHCAKRANEGFL